MKIETDRELQDPVYYMENNKVSFERVSSIETVSYIGDRRVRTDILYVLGNGKKFHTKEIFSSKEELLQSL